jgi:hypothetical protein
MLSRASTFIDVILSGRHVSQYHRVVLNKAHSDSL